MTKDDGEYMKWYLQQTDPPLPEEIFRAGRIVQRNVDAELMHTRSCNRHGYDKYEDATAIKEQEIP